MAQHAYIPPPIVIMPRTMIRRPNLIYRSNGRFQQTIYPINYPRWNTFHYSFVHSVYVNTWGILNNISASFKVQAAKISNASLVQNYHKLLESSEHDRRPHLGTHRRKRVHPEGICWQTINQQLITIELVNNAVYYALLRKAHSSAHTTPPPSQYINTIHMSCVYAL